MHTPMCFFRTKPLHVDLYFGTECHILSNLRKVFEHTLRDDFIGYMVDMIPLR